MATGKIPCKGLTMQRIMMAVAVQFRSPEAPCSAPVAALLFPDPKLFNRVVRFCKMLLMILLLFLFLLLCWHRPHLPSHFLEEVRRMAAETHG